MCDGYLLQNHLWFFFVSSRHTLNSACSVKTSLHVLHKWVNIINKHTFKAHLLEGSKYSNNPYLYSKILVKKVYLRIWTLMSSETWVRLILSWNHGCPKYVFLFFKVWNFFFKMGHENITELCKIHTLTHDAFYWNNAVQLRNNYLNGQ